MTHMDPHHLKKLESFKSKRVSLCLAGKTWLSLSPSLSLFSLSISLLSLSLSLSLHIYLSIYLSVYLSIHLWRTEVFVIVCLLV